MPIDCYYFPVSPPSRTVILLAKALGIHFNLKIVNIPMGEHLKPEFLQVFQFILFSFLQKIYCSIS